nr:MAG TPA: hypothetical protein [Caudoviricetes sp.]
MQKSAQICTILDTSFLPRSASAGGAWMVRTKCTKRRMFSARARRGSKRALWGQGRDRHTSPKAAGRTRAFAEHGVNAQEKARQNGAGCVWFGI